MHGFNPVMVRRGAVVLVAALALAICFLMLSKATLRHAYARDFGQWENTNPKISAWYARLKQPDNGISCCGTGDAYWADESNVVDDGHGGKQVVAVITDDRDDGPLGRIHVDVGTRFLIPPNKITRQDGNPTGHVILFLSYPITHDGVVTRPVLCYVMNGGV